MDREETAVSETVIVKSRRGVVRSMTQDEADALRKRAEANAVSLGQQLDEEAREQR